MAKQRIEYQDMIDLDGYRKAVAESRVDMKAFADDVNKLLATMLQNSVALKSELGTLFKANQGNNSNQQLQEYAQRAAGLSQQVKDQNQATQLLTQTQKQNEAVMATLSTRLEKLIAEYAQLEQGTGRNKTKAKQLADEMVNVQSQMDKLAKVTKTTTSAAKEITGQYNKLQHELAEARKELKAMDNAFDSNTGKINKNNAAAVLLANKINTADTSLKKMSATMGQHQLKVGQYENALSGLAGGGVMGLIGSFGLLGLALTKVIEIGDKALEKMGEFEQLRGGLKAVTDGSRELGQVQQFLESTADKLGIRFTVLAQAYKGIKVGTEGTALEGAKAERIFKAFVTRLAELKVPAEKAEKALLALEQMISKGTVGAEELRQQLGDAMPGAFKLFADAAGVSTMELNDMLKNGEVLAVDILPKVADQLEKTFSGQATANVESLAGATARLDNQTGLLLDTFNQQAGITGFFAKIKNGIADTLAAMRLAVKDGDWLTFFNSFGRLFNPGAIFTGVGSSDALSQEQQLQAFREMSAGMRKAKLDMLKEQAESAKNEADFLAQTPAQKKAAMERYKANLEEYNKLYRENIKLQAKDRADAIAQEQRENKDAHDKKLADLKTRAEELSLAERNALIARYQQQIKLDQELVKKRPDLVNSLNADIAANKEYIKVLEGVNKAKAKSDAADAKRDEKDRERDAERKKREAEAAQRKAEQEAEQKLREALAANKTNTNVQTSGLETSFASGAMSEAEYINQRMTILQDGVLREQEILRNAGKENTTEYAQTQQELNDIATDYIKKRNKLQEDAFKVALNATKDAITSDGRFIESGLKDRLAQIETAYDEARGNIEFQVARGQITEMEGDKRQHDLKLQYLDDIQRAVLAAADTQEQLIKKRIEQLRAEGKTEAQIAEALQLEKIAIEKTEQDRADADAKRDKNRSEEVARKKIEDAKKVAEAKKQLEQNYFEVATAAINGFFDVSNAFRDQDLSNLEKQKEHELELAGDSESKKAEIEARFAQKTKEIRKQQASAEKAQAIFNIALSSAQAIAKTLATGGPLAIPLAISIGALAAVQAAIVSAKPIPEFYKGTSDAPEGPAWVGERGYELIESKKGGKSQYRLAAEKQIAYLNKHDRVYTHAETKRILQTNQEIASEVRSAPGGSRYVPPVVVNSGITKADLMEAFGSQPVQENYWDDKGYRQALREKELHRIWKQNYLSLPRSKH
ncbi:tape measure protein [Spirosoma sp. BT702]|uniref:Tape measure protein n=1 Tax=Spirosoma profusum TaxID=2771354 RepID=A0A927AW25_9BACT|nr:tape measure protein [Spirosoma profusum]MBD2705508.1 tape measure protein [Spirosoma profusum]